MLLLQTARQKAAIQADRAKESMPQVDVHADQACTVDEADQSDPSYAILHRAMITHSIKVAQANGKSLYNAVQHMVFARGQLVPVIREWFTDQNFKDVDGVYKALDCGLLGKNADRRTLHPMLKVYGKAEYVRADSSFEFNFRHM